MTESPRLKDDWTARTVGSESRSGLGPGEGATSRCKQKLGKGEQVVRGLQHSAGLLLMPYGIFWWMHITNPSERHVGPKVTAAFSCYGHVPQGQTGGRQHSGPVRTEPHRTLLALPTRSAKKRLNRGQLPQLGCAVPSSPPQQHSTSESTEDSAAIFTQVKHNVHILFLSFCCSY